MFLELMVHQAWQHQGGKMNGLRDEPMYFTYEGDDFYSQYTKQTDFTKQKSPEKWLVILILKSR